MKWRILLLAFLLFVRVQTVHITSATPVDLGTSIVHLQDGRVLTAYSTACGTPPLGDATITYGVVRELHVAGCAWGV